LLCSRLVIMAVLTTDRRQSGRDKARAGLRKKNKDNKSAVLNIKHSIAEQSKERLADSLKGDNRCV
jgi:CMP-2-keto-3-deoxyoctulosonic acid synthetase